MRLHCDCCCETPPDPDEVGAWFVFNDYGGLGNARCPDCLPDQPGPVTDLARL